MIAVRTNEHRAERARAALDAYATNDPFGIDHDTLRDLIADLGHWADRNGMAFEHEIIHALSAWRHEKAEEVRS